MGQEYGSHLVGKVWWGASHEVQLDVSWGCSHLRAWMGLEDPLPMAYSHSWQIGAGYWWRPQFLLLGAPLQSCLSVFIWWLLASPKSGNPRGQSRGDKSFTTYSWKLPTITSVYIDQPWFTVGEDHIRTWMQKSEDHWEPSWRLAKTHSNKYSSYLTSQWWQNIIHTFSVQITMA